MFLRKKEKLIQAVALARVAPKQITTITYCVNGRETEKDIILSSIAPMARVSAKKMNYK